MAHPFGLFLARIPHLGIGAEGPGIDAEVAQPADKGIGQGLENARREWAVRSGGQLAGLAGPGVGAGNRGLGGRRQQRDQCIQELAYPLVASSGAHKHRDDLLAGDALLDTLADFLGSQPFALQILQHQVIIGLGDGLGQLLGEHLYVVLQLRRHFPLSHLTVVAEEQRLAGNQVHDTAKVAFFADRQLRRRYPGAVHLA